jgi:predicted RNA-binding Zn-ribbon protein involved in translation (DUF1610 family)
VDVANELQASPIEGGVQVVRETMETLKSIRTFILNEFKKDVDFGVIPGTGGKNTLLQPGAQKTVMFFNAAPDHAITPHELGDGHVEYVVVTRLIHRGTGTCIGSGVGSCSTMEKKYRYRDTNRKCPKCGKEAIFRSKQAQGGWYCWAKKDGCGAQFKEGDPAIAGQAISRAENPDIYEVRNTVLKIGVKRSLVAAALSLGCLSELFTQDIEETFDLREEEPPAPRPREPHPNASGYKTGKYASPGQVAAYLKATEEFCADRNQEWLDRWTGRDGIVQEGVGEILHPIQMTRHLLKWAVANGLLKEVGLTVDPETGKLTEKCSSEQEKGLVALVYARDPDAVGREGFAYYERQMDIAMNDMRKKAARDREMNQGRVAGKGDAWEGAQ